MAPTTSVLRSLSWMVVAVLPASVGCSGGGGAQDEPASTPAAEASPESPPPDSQVASGRFVGHVIETMDAGSYTYVLLERDDEQVWAAGPQTEVGLGEELVVGLEMKMDDFHSESLNHTFDAVYFVPELRRTSGATPVPIPTDNPQGGAPRLDARKTPLDIDFTSIEKPEGGHRVADLWDRRNEFVGAEVVVRGRVVKYNANILGRNWLHIQDGSGDADAGTHDLTVLTTSEAAVGDLVTVRGVLQIDRDFGAGYVYAVLVEDAQVEIE